MRGTDMLRTSTMSFMLDRLAMTSADEVFQASSMSLFLIAGQAGRWVYKVQNTVDPQKSMC